MTSTRMETDFWGVEIHRLRGLSVLLASRMQSISVSSHGATGRSYGMWVWSSSGPHGTVCARPGIGRVRAARLRGAGEPCLLGRIGSAEP
jgi:hypothetical protein